jgi:hypothetical protein
MERISFHDEIARNKLKSLFLMILVFAVLLAIGFIIGMALGPDYFTIIMIVSKIIFVIQPVDV